MTRPALVRCALALLVLTLTGCGLSRADLSQKAPYGPSHNRSVPILTNEQPGGMYTVLAIYEDARPRERPSTLGLEGVARDIGADAILALQIYSHTERRKNFFGGGVATTQSSGPQGSTTTTETVPEYSDVKFYRYTYRFIRTATAGNTP